MKKYFFAGVLLIILGIGLFFVFGNKLLDNKNGITKTESTLNKTSETKEKNLEEDETSTETNYLAENNLALEVLEPKDKSTISSSTVTITGKTVPQAEVFINEKEVKADSEGNFSLAYELSEGENIIYISANDNWGNYVEKYITVYLESVE